jgi:hypothetical protein
MKKLIIVLTVVFTLLCSTMISSAAEDPSVVLVNPGPNSTVYSSNLLISVKLTEPRTIKVKVYEEQQMVNGTLAAINLNTLTTANGTINAEGFTSVVVSAPDPFTSNNNLSFYTKQVSLKPGLYKIQIDTLDAEGKAIYSDSSYVIVKEKPAVSEEKIFETPQSGTMQFLQNLLKTIFGD